MSSNLIVAGGASDFTKPVHVLLKEAVQANWSSITTDPPVTDITFSNTWFTGYGDIHLIFRHSVEVRDITRRSVDWRFMPMTTFVDIHIFVRGNSVEEEPVTMHKVRTALDRLIESKKTTLLSNCSVTLENSNEIEEKNEHQQDTWHWLYSAAVRYTKVLV